GGGRPRPLRHGSGARDRLLREPAYGERRHPRARRPLRGAGARRAGRARPVDEPACGAVPCGRGLPRGLRRRLRRGPVYAARRGRRRPAGADRTRPPGRAAAPRARVPRGRPGGPGGAMMNRALLLVSLAPLLARAEPPARLAGRVTDDAGRPVVGALVTARHLELARETTVYADGDGRWALPPLEPGRYHLRARRPGFRDRTDVVDLADSTPVGRALVLERETDPRELAWQLPANRWLALAVAHLPDDAAREEFLRQCTFCHQQGSWATRVQRDPDEWRKIFVLMARMGGILSSRVRSGLPEALNAAYDEASYVPALGEHFAPPPPPDAVAAHAVITEWEVGGTGSMQHDITVHPDGRIYSADTTQDKLYRLDPRTGERRTFDIPRGDSPLGGVFTVMQPIPANADAHLGRDVRGARRAVAPLARPLGALQSRGRGRRAAAADPLRHRHRSRRRRLGEPAERAPHRPARSRDGGHPAGRHALRRPAPAALRLAGPPLDPGLQLERARPLRPADRRVPHLGPAD